MPTNIWAETLDIKQHIELDHEIDMSTEAGIAQFESIKLEVTAVLKSSVFYVSDDEFAGLSKDSADYTAVYQLRTIMRWLAEAGEPGKYSQELNYLYDWADTNRVWLGP